MSISVVRTLDEFQGLRPIWNEVLEESGSYAVQLSHEWLLSYWQHLAGDAQVEILIHKDKNDRVMGFTPLMIKKHQRLGGIQTFSKLTFLADDCTDYSDFVIRGNKRGGIIANEITPYIESKKGSVDLIHLRRIPYDSPNWDLLKRHWGARFFPEYENPLVIPEGGFDSYFSSRSSSLRAEVRRKRRDVQDELDFQIEQVDIWDEKFIKKCVSLANKRAETTGHQSPLMKPKTINHFSQAGLQLAEQGMFRGWACRDGENLIAYRLGFVYADTFYEWRTSFDPEYYEYSPGLLLVASAIEACFHTGLKRYNFMIGAEGWKLRWANSYRWLYSYYYESGDFKNRFYRFASAAKDLLLPGTERNT